LAEPYLAVLASLLILVATMIWTTNHYRINISAELFPESGSKMAAPLDWTFQITPCISKDKYAEGYITHRLMHSRYAHSMHLRFFIEDIASERQWKKIESGCLNLKKFMRLHVNLNDAFADRSRMGGERR
jgi:hypothetical protein